MAEFIWKPDADSLRFLIRFTTSVRAQTHDEVLENGFYYTDFYGATGPAEQADWDFKEADLSHVRRMYYPDQKVLRFVFYPVAGARPRFEISGNEGRVFTFLVAPSRLVPLGSKTASGKGKKKLVILDPGHGGKSLGAQTSVKIGGRNYEEKDLVLQISRRMLPLFEKTPNLEARMTRTNDTYISLEDRIDFAQKAAGDLFLSIHLNATDERRKNARGFEVYYLSDGTRETNRQLEDLENDRGIKINEGLSGGGNLRMILTDLANTQLSERRQQSYNLCQLIDTNFRLAGPFRTDCRGIKPAAFRVLMNYGMPAALAECGFIDNAEDAALLIQPKIQEQIAALLFNAINLYFSRTDPDFQGYQAPTS